MKTFYSVLFTVIALFLFKGNAFSQTPVAMASQPSLTYTENFGDIANWTFNGSTGTFSAGIGSAPWKGNAMATGSGIPNPNVLTTATISFAAGASGGVQKGTANIQFLTTGTTANTTSLGFDLFLNFTGTNAGTISFDAATVFNTTGDRVGSIKVYGSTDGATWSEVAGATFTATNNVAGSASISSVALPASFNGSSTARLRFYYYNGPTNGTAGSRPKISVDNLVITSVLATTPALDASPTALTFSTTNINTSSTPQSYVLSGSNITDPVSVGSSAPFFISESVGGPYTTAINIPAASLAGPKTIYVQFSPTVAGTPSGSITNTSGTASKSVTVSGTAFDPNAPILSVNPGTLPFGATGTGSNSASLSYTLTATNLTNDITLNTAAPFSISTNNSDFSASLNILKTDAALAAGKTIYVRYSPTATGAANGSVSNISAGATTQTVTLSGTGVGLINLTESPYLQTFDGIGSGLPTGISVKTGATVAVLGTDAAFGTAPVVWNNTGGAFKNFASGDNDEGVAQASATDRALGVRQVGGTDPGVAFVFQVANTTGKINFVLDFNLQSLDAGSPRTTTWRVDYGFGANPSSYIIGNTTGTLTTGGNSFTNTPIHVNFGNALDNQSGIITIRIVTVTSSSGSGNRPSTGIDDFTLSWEDPTAKTISVSTTAIPFPTTNIGSTSILNYKIVNQTNLTQPVLLEATAPFTISTDNSTFVAQLSIPAAEAVNKTIYVKFAPTSTGVYNGTITHSSDGAVSKVVNLSGEAVDPAALVFNFNTCSVTSIPGSGFLSTNITGTQKWACSQYGRNSSNGVDVNGFSGGAAQSNDAWLVSPALNLNNIVNLPVLSFYSRGEFSGPKLQLYISTTYNGSGTINLADWTEVPNANFPEPPGSATTTFTLSDNIDLSSYKAAPKVYIAFRYTSSAALGAARWTVDDIAITDQSTLLSVSPVQLAFGEGSVGGNSAGQAVSFKSVGGSADFTITPPAGYQVSDNNSSFTAGSLIIPQATAAAGTTFYVRFSPVAKALKVIGNINVSTDGTNKDIVSVTGSSYPKAETFDAACYNISFFGSNSTNTPTKAGIQLQIDNIATAIARLNADVIGVEEVSSDSAFAVLTSKLPGYASFLSNRWSYSFEPPDPSFPPQKIGFVYNTSTMTLSTTEPPRVMFEAMYDSARLNLPNHRLADYPTGTPSSFWASGRLPYMATFEANINGVLKKIRMIVIHAKSGGDAASYGRRQYDAKLLKDSLDAFYANDNVILVGDYNDRVVTSIYTGHVSSYLPFVNDEANYNILTKPLDQAGRASFPGSTGMIDHITITNDLTDDYISNSTDIEDPRLYIANYNSVTASDHLPVYSRFALIQDAPVIGVPTVTQPTCATTTGTIVVNATGSGVFEYSIDNGANWQESNEFTALAVGSYTILARVKAVPAAEASYSSNPVVLSPATGCICVSPVAQSYIASTQTGNQAHRGELGLSFTVVNPAGILVKQLGAFDDGGNGITGLQPGGGVKVAIFNKTTHAIVSGLEATVIGLADTLSGNHRLVNIPAVLLPQGEYVLVAKGYGPAEMNGNLGNGGGPYPAGNDGGGAITFGAEASYGADDPNGFFYPSTAGSFGSNHQFLAGTFTFTTTGPCPAPVANLASLVISQGTLAPAFDPATTSYNVSVDNSVATISVTPTTADPAATIKVNGNTVANGNASQAIALAEGSNNISIVVTATDGTTIKTYTVTVVKASSGTCQTAATQAYIASTSTGTQAFKGELGMQFIVNNASGIIINQLGVFDDGGNGITGTQPGGTIRVAVFNRATHEKVPGLDVSISGNGDAYTGNHRMRTISPVTLPMGDYVIVAKGYGPGEMNGNIFSGGGPFPAGNDGGGAITFGNQTSYGADDASGFSYPSTEGDFGTNHVFLAGTFNFTTVIPCGGGTCESAPALAYPASNAAGNQAFRGELGMQFIVNNPAGINIKQLGAFDDGGNGIAGTQPGGSVRVAIFDRATHNVVPGLDVSISGTGDTYNGFHQMKNIAPVTLPAGDYVVVAKGYNASEMNGNVFNGGGPYPVGDDGGGAISFGSLSSYGADDPNGFGYPSTEANFGSSHVFLAGSFNYTVNVNCASSATRMALTATDTAAQVKMLSNTQTQVAKIYPNPTNGRFNLQLTNLSAPKLNIQIMNASGQAVEQKTVSVLAKTASLIVQFNLVNQPSGIYLLKVQSADGVKTEKLVIQR